MPFYPHPAATYSTPANPTVITSVKMAGLAGAITPLQTGRIFVVISGTMFGTSANATTTNTLAYGTGTAPANQAASTGTVAGGIATMVTSVTDGANQKTPFVIHAIITGLTVGTAYWLDLQSASSAGNSTLSDIAITAIEV